MATTKTLVIRRIFDARYDPESGEIANPIVTLEEVTEAIREGNAELSRSQQLSARNPANFFKDFIRNTARANENWPNEVLEKGYTAKQRTGGNACFEFVALKREQAVPFPPTVPVITEVTPRHRIQSASLPLASRRLGRNDEPWLIQVATRLRIIETHLTLESGIDILHIDHLQMSVKLRHSEIDAIFLAVEDLGETRLREILVTCEAKTRADDILPDQILAQVKAVFGQPRLDQELVLPIAIKAIGESQVYLVEFETVRRGEAESVMELSVATSAVYELVPAVPGIGT